MQRFAEIQVMCYHWCYQCSFLHLPRCLIYMHDFFFCVYIIIYNINCSMHFKYFIHIPVFKLDRLIHFYPTTRFCPFFVDWSIYVFRISISTQKGIFGLNILLYTFTMLSYQSSEQLLISLCQRNIFFTIFLTFTSYEKKKLRYKNGWRQA